MKKRLKKVIRSIAAFLLVSTLAVVGTVLNPSLLYAKSTQIGNVTVYHQQALHPNLTILLQKSKALLSESAIYDENYTLDLCLNDGSSYPSIISKIKGIAFGHGFYNKVVMTAHANMEYNEAELYGKKWPLDELIAHEMVHCHQFNTFGWQTLRMPTWKLEGYAEFIARKSNKPLVDQITRFKQLTNGNSTGWIDFENGTGTPTQYESDHLLVHYLLTVKNWTYAQLVQDTTPRAVFDQELEDWYQDQMRN